MIEEPIGVNIKMWTDKSIDLQSAIKYHEIFLKTQLLNHSARVLMKRAWVESIAYPTVPDGCLNNHWD